MSTGFNALGFIKSNSLSYTEIQNDLTKFVEALSEDEKLGFKTLFEGTNSQILIEMISAKSSDEIYHIITSREENLMQYLNRRDSAIAIAQNDAYSVFRGNNIKLRITMTPHQTITQLPKMTTIATAGDYDIIITEDLYLPGNQSVTFDAYVGKVKEQSLVADTSDLLVFRFTNEKISDQIALYLDGTAASNEVPISDSIVDLIDDKYFCMTNAYNGVDVLYLNTRTNYTHRYQNGSTLTLKYIELDDIQDASLDVESEYGTITAVSQISETMQAESIASIRSNSALYAETQNRIVARDDFQKVMCYNYPIFADATSKDFSNAQVNVTYVKKDGELLTTDEYNTIYAGLYKRRGFGIPMCMLTAPNVLLNFPIKIVLQLKSNTDANISEYVRKVLEKYELVLNNTIDFSSIEYELEGYDFVKVARIELVPSTYTANTNVREGTIFAPTTPDGYYYIVRNPRFLTGATEPTWNTTIGSTTQDTNIIWTCEARSYVQQPSWTSTAVKQLGDVVWTDNTTVQYRFTGYIRKSGSTEPTWPETLDSVVNDGQILWKAIDKSSSASTWTASTIYNIGQIVNPTTESSLSYQALNYLCETSATEPTWSHSSSTFADGNIEYSVVSTQYDPDHLNAFKMTLDWNQYCLFQETVEVV